MNKSKFLKKSLAAVLAVLMVVAMIPLSAAASAVVSVVTIDGESATLNGDTYSAAISSPTGAPTIKVTLANGEGYVEHDGANGLNDADKKTDGTWEFDMTTDEFEAGTASFRVYDDGTTTTPTATYKVTYTVKNGAEDCGVKSVTAAGQYGNTAVDGSTYTYTITLPYGTTNLANKAIKVVLSDKNASITSVTGGATTVAPVTGEKGSFELGTVADVTTAIVFTVVAEDGVHTQDYTIKLQIASTFKSFSVEGQRKDAKIDTTASPKTIDVYMPYETKVDANKKWQFTPKFEMVYPSAEVTATKVTAGTPTVTLKSGEKIELSDFVAATNADDDVDVTNNGCTFNLTVKYTDNVTEAWTLNFHTPAKDPMPAIKGVRVGNIAGVIDETAKTVTLTLPASKRATGTNVQLLASAGAKILAVETGVAELTVTGDWDSSDLLALDTTKDHYKLRVTAAGDEDGDNPVTTPGNKLAVQDYELYIKSTQDVAPAINEMKLEDVNGKQYTATIGADGTILFKLPYSVTKATDGTYTQIAAKANLQDWKLYYSLTEGASCSALVALPSGKKLAGTEGIFPGTFDGKTTNGTAIEVSIDEKTYKTYKIAVEQGKPSSVATLTDFKVTTLDNSTDNKFENIKLGDNTFAASGSKDLTANVPYSKYSSYEGGSFVSATLPAGAKLCYIDSKDDGTLKDLAVLTKFSSGTLSAKLPRITESSNGADDGYLYNGEKNGGDKPTPLELVVVSEAGLKTAGAATWNTNDATDVTKDNMAEKLGRGGYATYTLTVKQDAAKTAAKLDKFDVYDSATKTTIKGVVKHSSTPTPSITLTLPYGYDEVKAPNSIANTLYLDWASSNYEAITLQETTGTGADGKPIYGALSGADAITKLKLDSDGNVEAGDVIVATNAATPTIKKNTKTKLLTSVMLVSEDGSKTVTYALTIKFEKEKTESKLNSVTIDGRSAKPDANNKVTITLPKSTEVTALKPTFNVSAGAFVSTVATKASANTGVIAPDTKMNFTAPKTVYVYSENATNMNAYTIEVKVDDEFSDVKPGDWFYTSVMEANKRGIIKGYTDGRFGPNESVTRVQFATMMARVDGFKASEWENKASKFSDMNGITGEPAAAVAYCADKGYITGDGGTTTFRPNATITREEMAAIISRVRKLNVENVNITTRFADDAKIAGWAKNYVYACVNDGMLKGEGNNVFNPLGKTTRAAAATAAVRVDNAK